MRVRLQLKCGRDGHQVQFPGIIQYPMIAFLCTGLFRNRGMIFFLNVILFASFLREKPWNYSYRGYFALAYCQICRHVNTFFLKKNLSSHYITRNCEISGVQYYQYDTNGRNMFFDLQRKPSLLLLKHSI